MRQKLDPVTRFDQVWTNERVAGIPSAVEVVHSDEGGELKGDFINSAADTTSVRSSVPLMT